MEKMIRLQEAIDAVIWLVSSEVPQAQYKLLVSVAVMVNSFNGPFKAIKSEHPIQAAEQKRLRVMMLLALPRLQGNLQSRPCRTHSL